MGIYRDIAVANRFVETFLVHSWTERLREHERQTIAERELEERVLAGRLALGNPTCLNFLITSSKAGDD